MGLVARGAPRGCRGDQGPPCGSSYFGTTSRRLRIDFSKCRSRPLCLCA
nr:MAG TPA: hypothetical protein [Caudoviricetes sp.]DAK60968.1 MAG TPA: hypothetical protein [Caudoviricetes sp.]DAN43129.1 MAG TPA: hypothetical protein [Caudoviricetes sp.]DAW54924.1 MAG TPA: hypothetical protein [Caudoviricetes sp.]